VHASYASARKFCTHPSTEISRVTGERLPTDVLAIGSPVATAPHVDTRLGADPIAVLPIASRSPA